jgi:hypothetical protein
VYTGSQLVHDGRPTRVTPTRIAASLAEGIIHGPAFDSASSLQAPGAAAWLRIVGGSETSGPMTMLLAVRATAQLRAVRCVATRYTIIGPIIARRRPPDEQDGDT